MSFLGAGRLAGKEGAYFFQETKHAVNRLAEKSAKTTSKYLPSSASSTPADQESQADVLPEVLRHSLPSNIFGKPPESSTFSTASKWALPPAYPSSGSVVSPDALNPLRAYVSLPQVTFGPQKWQLPSQGYTGVASTANELRKDRYTPMNSKKLKAAAEGLTQIGKAFAVATVIIFGGTTIVFGWVASKLELHNSDDIRTKGKDIVGPKFEALREQLVPLRTWAEDTSKKWHLSKEEDIKLNPLVKELSKMFGAKTSS